MARPSIYGPKEPNRLQVISMTPKGKRLFEAARAALKKFTKWKGTVSDGDTVEFLVRGRVPPKE